MLDTFRSFFAPPFSADDSLESKTKLLWIVRLRWVAIVAQLLAIAPALHFEMLEARLAPIFSGVVAALAALNLGTWLALKRGFDASQRHLLVQLGADIIGLSWLLVLTGGAWNPMVPILFVHSVLGALLLEGRLALLFFVTLLASLGLIQFNSYIPPGLHGALVPAEILFPAQLVVAVVFWILTVWLSNTLQDLQGWVRGARERQTRIDRLRAVGALAAGLSHEFATPLNTAQLKLSRIGRAHDLEDDPDLQTAKEELDRCAAVLRHMAGSQLDPEKLDLHIVDVDALARQVVKSVSNVHPEAGIHFLSDGKGPKRALLPAVAFSQALINLIDNSLESGGQQDDIEVVVQQRGNHVDLCVQDRGHGWPEVVKKHLGEPFVTTKPQGIGLGLYYVHSLSEAIGATLTLEDREFGGARARISLPSPATLADQI